jgi:hypothetical protein
MSFVFVLYRLTNESAGTPSGRSYKAARCKLPLLAHARLAEYRKRQVKNRPHLLLSPLAFSCFLLCWVDSG